MPTMPRLNKKTSLIAFKILGVPANLRKDAQAKKEDKINRILLYEETSRVR
jgi:hypothetical protein